MFLSIPNLDCQRWPALDEHGQMVFEAAVRRSRKHKETPHGQPAEAPPRMNYGNGEPSNGREDMGDESVVNNRDPDQQPPDWELHITQATFIELMTYFWSRTPEAAGILFGPVDDEPLVTRFIPDHLGRATAVSFELHTPSLNQALRELKSKGQTCKGIVHSHPFGVTEPSSGDQAYFRRLFSQPANAETTHVFVPIVCGGRLYPYVYTELGVAPATLVVV